MPRLATKDFAQAFAFTARLHACHDPAELRRLTVRGISELIGADLVTFEHFAPTVPMLWAVAEPDQPYQPWMWETFLAHLDEHPVIAHYQRTGDLGALKVSDFLTSRAWQRTALYQKLYRTLDFEDQMGVCLGPPNREFYSVVLARNTRSFSERDRALLNLLRSHITQAHRNARAFERLHRLSRRQCDVARWLSHTAILLDRQGRVRHCPAGARAWLCRYFGESFQRGQLPTELETWVRRHLGQPDTSLPSASTGAPLVREGNGSRLVLRLRMDSEGQVAILAEEQTAPCPAAARAMGLTRRQIEVLVEVEKGKSNEEIAAALFISPLTVRTHLDNIFDTLGVTNRTAAVARLRQLV